ncbi:MAG: hypothetical protein JNM56_25845 [Planctomycetia bacterium]|nr:hypothetical protein [Planctomycetia bacterium]
MNAVRATWKNGQIVPDGPVDWADGARLLVQPDNDDFADSPEAIADWLRWYDSLQPLIFTAEEQAAWEANRQARKDWEKSHVDERDAKLRGIWP